MNLKILSVAFASVLLPLFVSAEVPDCAFSMSMVSLEGARTSIVGILGRDPGKS